MDDWQESGGMTSPITIDELLRELENASSIQNPEGFSMEELQEITKKGQHSCSRLVKAGIKAGRIKVARRSIIDMAGRPNMAPCYVIVEPKCPPLN